MDKKQIICYMKQNGVDLNFVIDLASNGLLNDLDIVTCAINNADADSNGTIDAIVNSMPKVLRNSSQILKLVLEKLNHINYDLLELFKPIAITKENMKLAMSKGLKIYYYHLTNDMLSDKEIMIYYLKRDAKIYSLLSKKMRSDPDILRAVIEGSGHGNNEVLKSALPMAFTDENIDLVFEKQLIINFEDLSYELISNRDFVIRYLRKSRDVYRVLSEEMRSDPEVLEAYILSQEDISPVTYSIIKKVSLPQALTDKNICLAIENGIIGKFDLFIENDKRIVLLYIKQKKMIDLRFLSEEMRSDPEVLECILENVENPNDIDIDKFLPSAKTKENMEKAIERGIYFTPNLQVITNDGKTVPQEQDTLSNVIYLDKVGKKK